MQEHITFLQVIQFSWTLYSLTVWFVWLFLIWKASLISLTICFNRHYKRWWSSAQGWDNIFYFVTTRGLYFWICFYGVLLSFILMSNVRINFCWNLFCIMLSFTQFEVLCLDQVFLDFFLRCNIFVLSMLFLLIFEVLCLDQVFLYFF